MANTPNLDLVKPAGTDHALVSVINANSDKIDGGFGTLSEQIATYEIPTNTIANIESALATYASGLANNEIRTVKFTVSPATTMFAATSYIGTIRRVATGRYNILAQGFLEESGLIMGNYRNSTWTWQQIQAKLSTATFSDVSDFNSLSNGFMDSFTTSATGTARANLPFTSNASLVVSGSGNYIHLTAIRSNGEIYTRNKNNGAWDDNWARVFRNTDSPSGYWATVSNTSKTFNVGNNARLLLIVEDSSADRCGMMLVYSASGGKVTKVVIRDPTAVTIDVSVNNKITITSPGATRIRFDNIIGDPIGNVLTETT